MNTSGMTDEAHSGCRHHIWDLEAGRWNKRVGYIENEFLE